MCKYRNVHSRIASARASRATERCLLPVAPHAKMQACLCCSLPYTPAGENKPRSVGHTPITDAKKYCYEPAALLRSTGMKRGVLHAKAQGHKM